MKRKNILGLFVLSCIIATACSGKNVAQEKKEVVTASPQRREVPEETIEFNNYYGGCLASTEQYIFFNDGEAMYRISKKDEKIKKLCDGSNVKEFEVYKEYLYFIDEAKLYRLEVKEGKQEEVYMPEGVKEIYGFRIYKHFLEMGFRKTKGMIIERFDLSGNPTSLKEEDQEREEGQKEEYTKPFINGEKYYCDEDKDIQTDGCNILVRIDKNAKKTVILKENKGIVFFFVGEENNKYRKIYYSIMNNPKELYSMDLNGNNKKKEIDNLEEVCVGATFIDDNNNWIYFRANDGYDMKLKRQVYHVVRVNKKTKEIDELSELNHEWNDLRKIDVLDDWVYIADKDGTVKLLKYDNEKQYHLVISNKQIK